VSLEYLEMKMKTFLRFLCVALGIISLLSSSTISAQFGKCLLDSVDRPICAPPHGDIAPNSIGYAVCGRGQCVKDGIDRVLCSKEAGGGAIIDRIGRVRCVGGCEEAKESLCVRPQ